MLNKENFKFFFISFQALQQTYKKWGKSSQHLLQQDSMVLNNNSYNNYLNERMFFNIDLIKAYLKSITAKNNIKY